MIFRRRKANLRSAKILPTIANDIDEQSITSSTTSVNNNTTDCRLPCLVVADDNDNDNKTPKSKKDLFKKTVSFRDDDALQITHEYEGCCSFQATPEDSIATPAELFYQERDYRRFRKANKALYTILSQSRDPLTSSWMCREVQTQLHFACRDGAPKDNTFLHNQVQALSASLDVSFWGLTIEQVNVAKENDREELLDVLFAHNNNKSSSSNGDDQQEQLCANCQEITGAAQNFAYYMAQVVACSEK